MHSPALRHPSATLPVPIWMARGRIFLLSYRHASHGPFVILAVVSAGNDDACGCAGRRACRSPDFGPNGVRAIRISRSSKANGDAVLSLLWEGLQCICNYLRCVLWLGECPRSTRCGFDVGHQRGNMTNLLQSRPRSRHPAGSASPENHRHRLSWPCLRPCRVMRIRPQVGHLKAPRERFLRPSIASISAER